MSNSFANVNTNINLPVELFKPMVTDGTGVPELENSEIRKIASDVLNFAKYSFASVAANPDQEVRSDTLEENFQQVFTALKPEKQAQYRKTAVELVNAPQGIREKMFGRAGKFSSSEYLSMGFDRADEALPKLQINEKLLGIKTPVLKVPTGIGQMTNEGLLIPNDRLPGRISDFESLQEAAIEQAQTSDIYDMERLQDIWGSFSQADPFAGADTDDFEEQAVTDKLSLYITKVKCVDETGRGWLGERGDDEIALAGVSVDETGDTKKISEKRVGNSFDDGEQKTYSPHWKYHLFGLREGQYWPKAYKITLLMAEKDNNGLSKLLDKVYKKIAEKVKDAISKAVSSALKALVGTAIAKAIGEVVAWVFDRFVKWIIGLFKDDIFPPQILSCTVPSYGARWNYSNGKWGSPTSPRRKAHFYGHNGHYYVEYYWKLQA